jgi:uncharacterized membrane protein YfbV (UPF0208 family)
VNAGLAAVATYVVAGAWYVTNWGQLLPDFRSQGLNAQLHTAGGSQTLTHASSALWYLQRLMDPQLYVVFAALFVVGLAFCVWKPGALVRNRYPLALVVGTYVLFTILVVKDPRYTLSLLPGVAIVATSWTDALKPRLRSVAGVAIAACAVVTFLAISFGTQLLPKQVIVDVAGQEVALFAQRGYIIGPPTHEQWYQEAFVKRVAATKPGAELWYDGPGTLWFNHSGFYYFAARYGVRFSIVPDRADFIVRRRSSPPSAPSGFRPLESHRLPDGTWATLFQRNA